MLKKVLILMPAYNEGAVIQSTLNELRSIEVIQEWQIEILVINDGSTDETSKIVREVGIKVVDHPYNCGVGIALRTGFLWAKQNNFDAVIQIDADGQHPVDQINTLIKELEEQKVDILIGSRFLFGPWKTSRLRRSAMRFLAYLVSSGTGYKITDATSGFRISGRRAINFFAIHYPGEYLGDTVESLVLAHHEGLVISEIPAKLKIRQGGNPSHLGLRSSLHVLRVIVMVFLILIRPKSKGDFNVSV